MGFGMQGVKRIPRKALLFKDMDWPLRGTLMPGRTLKPYGEFVVKNEIWNR